MSIPVIAGLAVGVLSILVLAVLIIVLLRRLKQLKTSLEGLRDETQPLSRELMAEAQRARSRLIEVQGGYVSPSARGER